jgi:hypothetical protein
MWRSNVNLPFSFDKAIEGLSKVTLKGGLVGKATFAIMVVSLTLAAIAWAANNVWISAAALVMVFTIAFVMLWRLVNFADRHPQAALLEGAEFLVHEQIVHASKSLPVIPAEVVNQIESEVAEPLAIEGESAETESSAEHEREPEVVK